MTLLQVAWFFLIGVLFLGYAILDGFDLGVGFWHLFTKNDQDRRIFIRSIGPVWDGNEVWLLTAGGALFAAFPPVYATIFSGFYLALVLLLLGLILRVVSIEFRNQIQDLRWTQKWDIGFFVGSILPALLFGVALGNVVRGIPLNENGDYTGGFFGLLNSYALLIGITGLAMFATHGALYLVLKTEADLQQQARIWASKAWIAYFVLFLLSSVWSLVSIEKGSTLLAVISVAVSFISIICIRYFNQHRDSIKAFIASVMSIVGLFGAVGSTLFPNMVPASNLERLSLTIFNSSASQNTLGIMLIVALVGMPVVLGYTVFIYRTFAGPVTVKDLETGY